MDHCSRDTFETVIVVITNGASYLFALGVSVNSLVLCIYESRVFIPQSKLQKARQIVRQDQGIAAQFIGSPALSLSTRLVTSPSIAPQLCTTPLDLRKSSKYPLAHP